MESMLHLKVDLELIDIHVNPNTKEVSLMLSGTLGDFQADIRVATIPYDNETQRQVVVSQMEQVAKRLQNLQQWQEEKLTTKR